MGIAFRAMLALGVAVAALQGASASAAEKVYGVEISPNGKHYAVLRDAGEQRAFAIYNADDASAKPAGVGLGKNEVEDWEWGGDNHILLRISGEVAGVDTTAGVKTLNYSRWLSISRETGEFRTIFGNEQGGDYYYLITSAGALVASLPNDSDRSLFARQYAAVKPTGPTRLKEGQDELLYSLIEANLRTGDIKRRSEGDANTIDWIVTADGLPVARIDQYEKSKNVEILAAGANGKGFSKVATIDGAAFKSEGIKFFGAGAAPRTIQVMRDAGAGMQLFDYNLDAASFGPPISTPGPVTEAFYDARAARARIVLVSTGGGERPFHLDAVDQKAQATLEKALAGASVTIVSKSIDGSRMIARADYAGKPQEFYLYDKAGKRLELVAAN